MSDVSQQTVQLRLAGPGSDGLVESLGAAGRAGQPEGSHAVFGAGSEPVVIAVGSGFSAQGYTVIASDGAAAEFWQRCVQKVDTLPDTLCSTGSSARDRRPSPEEQTLLSLSTGQAVRPSVEGALPLPHVLGWCVAGGCTHGRAGLRAGSHLLWQASCGPRAHRRLQPVGGWSSSSGVLDQSG